ncbi:GntR family transcriptional regulator [Lysinibacter sp. HNR]|uniref:FadR/GntR family transcriptional regulator n=1 Tax=Lysinibacter sp. HNR TaxID=3031408 RepID=UPI0024353120|nr:GntR family transcriptional regulator [Lysinibacter sp. HNR]WGD37175.1 GntR family transcriptional regulator [Lysinibacter sp. HNR]
MNQPPESTRAWETVLTHIEAQLTRGELNPGDRLPGERALAAELGVGRSSVREAIRVLEALGLIRTQSGSGPSSGAIIVSLPSGGMATLMRLQVAAQGFAVKDVVNTRLILETAAVRELATRPERNLANSHELLAAMDNPHLGETEFLLLDAQYHLSLAEATGNTVLVTLMSGLRDSIERYVIEISEHITDWTATSRQLQEQHREILHAIEIGHASLADSRTSEHIRGYYDKIRPHTSPTHTNTLPIHEHPLPEGKP